MNFNGRVAVITGAGGGLGREYALAFAERGAKVVVNDLGGLPDGQGEKSIKAADKVVTEITNRGGVAVANYNSVEDGAEVIQTAIDNFGRIDILVNNAGILRDRSFNKLKDLDWDLVMKVHLRGAFKVTMAAWPYFKAQKFGRIIMTSSASGLYGNFGQANYSAAKMGLVGLSNTLAIEGEKYNIYCNTIAPLAGSRLTENIMPPEFFEAVHPKFVAPFVLYLCHESCKENGGIFETAAGWASKIRWQCTNGYQFRQHGDSLTPEIVSNHWSDMVNWQTPRNRISSQDTSLAIMESLKDLSHNEAMKNNSSIGSNEYIDPIKLTNGSMPEKKYSYTSRDIMLYALGVGVDIDGKDGSHLKFLYEGHPEFSALPTYGVIPAQAVVFESIGSGDYPGLNIDLTQILHGEHYLEVLNPLPTEATLTSVAKVSEVLDKGKGAVMIIDVTTKDEQGRPIIFNQFSTFITRAGGFNGKRNSEVAKPLGKRPNRVPDAVVEEKTSLDQSAIYRLSGDFNPLHLDPDFAGLAGFSQPILHGLCSFGFSARHILKYYAGNDVSKFKCIKTRFTKPVIPGQTLVTEMWKEGKRIHFVTKVKETGNVALEGGYVDLLIEEKAAETTNPATTPSPLKSEALFKEIEQRINAVPDAAKSIKGVFVWVITKDGKSAGQWVMDFNSSLPKVFIGSPDGKVDVTLTVSDDDFYALASGTLDPQQAFFKGKLKIKGNIMLTQKIGQLFKERAKL